MWRLWRRCGKSWRRILMILGVVRCKSRFSARRSRSPGTGSCRCITAVESRLLEFHGKTIQDKLEVVVSDSTAPVAKSGVN